MTHQLPLIKRQRPTHDDGEDYRREAGPIRPVRPPRPPTLSKSTLRLYLEWLDELRQLIERHGGEGVESWHSVPAMPDLADELRSIGDGLHELGDEMRELADSIEHAAWVAEKELAP